MVNITISGSFVAVGKGVKGRMLPQKRRNDQKGVWKVQKKVLTLLVLAAAVALFVGLFAVSADATPNMSPDKVTCTPCHTDGRKGDGKGGVIMPNAKPAAQETKKEAPKQEAPKKEEAAKPAAKPAAPAASTVKVTFKAAGKEDTQLTGYKVKDQVLVPLRTVAEALGAKVTGWDKAQQTATVAYAGKSFQVVAGKVVKGAAYVSAKDLAANLKGSFDEKTLTLKKGKGDVAREAWAQSGHNVANWGQLTADSPVNRDNCIACHDGQGFANQKTKRAELPEAVKNTPNSIDCASCHSERGKQIMASGNTPVLPNGYQVSGAGAGALCVTCHNGRKNPDPVKTPAPHRGPQSDVLYGFGGAEVAGASYPTSPHGANPDTCVSCHMGEVNGAPNHTFKIIETPAYVEETCGKCHNGLEEVNRTALGDYDGDKKIEGIQDEVEGLLALLDGAIKAKEAELGVKGGEDHGSFKWTDAAGQAAQVPEALYKAAWNYALIENDGSEGIHNPAYVVSLLQKSYKELTGKDVPNATLR